MSDTTGTQKIKTEILTARVSPGDKVTINTYVKKFSTTQEAFAVIAKNLNATPEIKTVEVEKNLEQVFEFASYQAFVDKTDTNIADSIKRALEYANTAKTNETNNPELLPGRHLEFSSELEHKLSLLYRFLKTKGKIPDNAPEKEYMERLFETLLTRHIDNNFDFLNKD